MPEHCERGETEMDYRKIIIEENGEIAEESMDIVREWWEEHKAVANCTCSFEEYYKMIKLNGQIGVCFQDACKEAGDEDDEKFLSVFYAMTQERTGLTREEIEEIVKIDKTA